MKTNEPIPHQVEDGLRYQHGARKGCLRQDVLQVDDTTFSFGSPHPEHSGIVYLYKRADGRQIWSTVEAYGRQKAKASSRYWKAKCTNEGSAMVTRNASFTRDRTAAALTSSTCRQVNTT